MRNREFIVSGSFMPDYAKLISSLIPAVHEAGAAIMKIYQSMPDAKTKADGSPVTEADRAAEKILLGALNSCAPDITIISEENAASHSLKAPEKFFLVDPLDGTREFLKRDGKGSFTVNVGLIENGEPTLGIVYAPALGDMFTGSKNLGATKNGKAIRTRTVPLEGRVAVASVSHRDAATDQWLSDNNISQTTSIGSSLKFCLLACGEADVYPRFGPTMEWDTAAGHAVLSAAGGIVVTPDNAPFLYGKADYRNGAFIASTGTL